MAFKYSVPLRNERLNRIPSFIGPTPTLRIRTGTPPLNVVTADTGQVLSTIVLPTQWMQAAANGSIQMNPPWADLSADLAGTAGHFRIYDMSEVCHLQGSVSILGGGGDMILDNLVFLLGQSFSVTAFTLTDGNA